MRLASARPALLITLLASVLAACSGGAPDSPSGSPVFLVTTTVVGSQSFSANRANYTIAKTSSGYTVTDKVGSGGTVTVGNLASLKFADMTLSLDIAASAAGISTTQLESLVELYVAFFNRVPDAAGMAFWIGKLREGMSLAQVAGSFYEAGTGFAAITGYSSASTNNEYVKVIYANVLGRTAATTPTDAEVAFWVERLAKGQNTRGTLVIDMLAAARNFAGDATYGWVVTLLTNKITVGKYVAIEQGVTYNTDTDSLTKGKAIAAAVTPTSTAAAISALGFTDTGFSQTTITPVASGTSSTAGVACAVNYSAFNSNPGVNLTSTANMGCTSSQRVLTGNGVPDHAVTGGAFATPLAAQNVSKSFSLTPSLATSATAIARGTTGYVLNSVKMDPGTDGTCASSATSANNGGGCVAAGGRDPWNLEALGGGFKFGADSWNAHVQPDGTYHYHGMPEGYLTRLNKGQAMTLIGFALDGYPVYARYGYTSATSAGSAIKVIKSSWQLKANPDAGRPSVSALPMGTFTQDYSYVAGSGDLDECNGRFGVTPEFPNGIYHYYVTDTFPFIQRCIKGAGVTITQGPPP